MGEEQLAKLPESSLHSKVEGDSLDENVNVAELDVVVPEGPESIVVSGGLASGSASWKSLELVVPVVPIPVVCVLVAVRVPTVG